MAEYGAFAIHPSMAVDPSDFAAAQPELLDRLRNNYPFFHPRYVGQMLKPPHPAADRRLPVGDVDQSEQPRAGRRAGDRAAWRRRSSPQLAGMFGFGDHLGHLTSSGTIANLEALFIARETHPGKGIAAQRRRALHARPDEPSARHSGLPRCRPTRPAGWTWTRLEIAAADRRRRHRRADRRHHRTRGDRPDRPGRAVVPQLRRPGPHRRRVRRLLHRDRRRHGRRGGSRHRSPRSPRPIRW